MYYLHYAKVLPVVDRLFNNNRIKILYIPPWTIKILIILTLPCNNFPANEIKLYFSCPKFLRFISKKHFISQNIILQNVVLETSFLFLRKWRWLLYRICKICQNVIRDDAKIISEINNRLNYFLYILFLWKLLWKHWNIRNDY